MMHPRCLMAWLTVAALSTTLVAAPKRSPDPAPDGSPLLVRDVGTQDIYALDLQLP
jgi:hypothetical protein